MTMDDKFTKLDRMRYTKDSLPSTLCYIAIVFNCLYFVSIYGSNKGNYYYNWEIGVSIIMNLLFMLFIFLASESMKNRKIDLALPTLLVGAFQIFRIFQLPMRAANTVYNETISTVVNGVTTSTVQELPVMDQKQFLYVVICLAVSGVCCMVAAVLNFVNTKRLEAYMKSLDVTVG